MPADLKRGSPEYEKLKEERSQVLWRAVEKVIPDIRQRTHIEMVASPHLLVPILLLQPFEHNQKRRRAFKVFI